jgi:hypothetical protein
MTDTRRAPRTTCKICWCSIYDEDTTVWVIAPSPGLAHSVCVATPPPPDRPPR